MVVLRYFLPTIWEYICLYVNGKILVLRSKHFPGGPICHSTKKCEAQFAAKSVKGPICRGPICFEPSIATKQRHCALCCVARGMEEDRSLLLRVVPTSWLVSPVKQFLVLRLNFNNPYFYRTRVRSLAMLVSDSLTTKNLLRL